MKAYQRTLEGGIAVATGNRIKDQLAAIMEAEPETQADEDLLAARWVWEYGGMRDWYYRMLSDERPRTYKILIEGIRISYHKIRTRDIRRRRQEMAADGSYPWPTDEAERRQKRAKGGAPG